MIFALGPVTAAVATPDVELLFSVVEVTIAVADRVASAIGRFRLAVHANPGKVL